MRPEPLEPEDRELTSLFSALSPTANGIAALEEKVVARVDAHPRSILREWLALVASRPLVNTLWMTAAVLTLLVSTPLGFLLGLLPSSPPAQSAVLKRPSRGEKVAANQPTVVARPRANPPF